MRLVISVLLLATGCDAKLSPYRITTEIPGDPGGFSRALFQSTGYSLLNGNDVELVNNGDVFDVMVDQITQARRSINIVMFIWRPGDPSDRIVRAVVERARAGVTCRILIDHFGSITFEQDIKPELAAAGCDVRMFRSLTRTPTKHRNHRKVMVVDGRVGLTGGFGIEKVWLGQGTKPSQWRDSNVVVRGPAVLQMQQAFAENWLEEGGALLPQSDFPEPDVNGPTLAAFVASSGSMVLTNADRLTQLVVAAAKERLWIANSYFIPSPGLIDLLVEKRRQGVDVRLMVASEATDHKVVLLEQRARYGPLLRAGIRICEYQPTLIHSKTMLVDDHLAVVGSINLDRASLDWMEEGALVMSDPLVAGEMEMIWEKDASRCKEMR